MKQKDLGDMLVHAGLITDQQLDTARKYQKSLGGRLAPILSKLGFMEEQRLTEFIANQEGLPIAEVGELVIPIDLVKSVPRDMIEKHQILPIAQTDKVLRLAMADPTDYAAIEEVQFITGKRIEIHLASHDQMAKAITQLFDESSAAATAEEPPIDESQLTVEEKFKAKSEGRLSPHKSDTKLRPNKLDYSSESELTLRRRDSKVVGTPSKWEELAPALIPVLIEKGVITEAELKLKVAAMKAARPQVQPNN